MIRNYLKVALRNLLKFKFISFINIFGLTVGFTCCLLILSYLLHELSYDRYNKNAKNTYRVERTFINPETGLLSLELGAVAPPVGPLLAIDFVQVRRMTRLLMAGNISMKWEEKTFNESNICFADENLLKIFDVPLLKGNPEKALTGPYSVMLSEEVAKRYFGDQDPMNKVVRFNNQFNVKVSGVFKELPDNAHLHPRIMISFSTLKDSAVYVERNLQTNWGNNAFYTYLLLPDGYDAKKLEAQLPAFLDRHLTDNGDGKFKPSQWSSLSLRRLTEIHLFSHKDSEIEENGDMRRVYIFSAIALFILLIACINYMNLSTARSALRAREIGVRKVVGAGKPELMGQFLSESVLVCCIAIVLAFGLTRLTLPWLNQASGLSLSISTLLQGKILLCLVLVPFATGILSGIYPAVFLSSFKPVRVLKGVIESRGGSVSFRKVLVTVQFAVSIILIISTATVFSQLRYMQHTSLGFSKDHMLTLTNNGGLNQSFESFRTELLSSTSVQEVSRSSRIPSGRLLDVMGSRITRGDSLAPSKADIKYLSTDDRFLPAFGVHIVAGRNFSRDFGTDTASFLINEEAVKALGLASNQEAIGKPLEYGGRKGTLIGVFNDFHFESMHQRILPLILLMPTNAGPYNNISIRISGNPSLAIAHIETTWKRFLPEVPFDYTFLDDRFARLYRSEQRQGIIFTIFACIAIFIACLGLLGLSAFTITRRIKEIGIRRVLGASTRSLVSLLSEEFLRLVAIAALIAFPVAWFAMSAWLQDFAYRIPMPWWIFPAAAGSAVLIALLTISFQAVKAAMMNPVKNLRSE